MRISTLVVLFASSCSVPEPTPLLVPDSGDENPGIRCRPPVQVSGTALELPFEPVETRDLMLTGTIEQGQVTTASELTYAIGQGYPGSVYATGGEPPYVIGCQLYVPGARVHWKEVTEDNGAGAVHLQVTHDEQLLMVLRGPGSARFELAGEFSVADGGVVCQTETAAYTRLPFRHTLTVNAKQVAGVEIVSPWPGCDERLVLPEGWVNELPAAFAVDPQGRRFVADNAKRQVGLIIDAPGGIDGRSGYGYGLGAGLVTIRAQTQLPVLGPKTITVVKPSQLTAFDARFQLVTGGIKTPVYGELDGGSIGYDPRVWPRLELTYGRASFGDDPLCVAPPASWACLRSSTHEVCDDEGKLLGPGICRLSAEVTDTPFAWSLEASVVKTGP